jgi:hypothetical protein
MLFSWTNSAFEEFLGADKSPEKAFLVASSRSMMKHYWRRSVQQSIAWQRGRNQSNVGKTPLQCGRKSCPMVFSKSVRPYAIRRGHSTTMPIMVQLPATQTFLCTQLTSLIMPA